jgi:hypothetical protein
MPTPDRPGADEEAHVLPFELKTGDIRESRTLDGPERI